MEGYSMTNEECNKKIQKSLRNSAMVKLMRDRLEKAGCPVGDNFFKAVRCPMPMSGGYIPGKGVIVCSNYLRFQDEVNQVLIHELIHAYDQCRAVNLKWSNCAHQACSEIRANNLSGDCHFMRELLRGYTNLKGHGPECVKRRAMRSVMANPACSQANAKDAVEAVWDLCYNDTAPFDKAP